MMKYYNIIWADDAIDSLYDDYKDIFDELNINIKKCYSSSEVIEYIKLDPRKVDGVITDAKYSVNQNDKLNERDRSFPGLIHLMTNIKTINKDIPSLILTGYGNLLYDKFKGELEVLDNIFIDVLNKSDDVKSKKEKIKKLCDKIDEINTKEHQIRRKYKDVFDVFNSVFLDKDKEISSKIMLDLLLKFENNEQGNITHIRNIMEAIFSKCTELSIFPNDCTQINQQKYFVTRREWNINEIIPWHISKNINSVIDITQDGSHLSSVQSSLLKPCGKYLYQSLVCDLMNILLWFKSFVNNLNREEYNNIKQSIPFIDKTKEYTKE